MGLNPFDLHALDTPPAFILSQDQTLEKFLTWFALKQTLAPPRRGYLVCLPSHIFLNEEYMNVILKLVNFLTGFIPDDLANVRFIIGAC